MCVKEPHLSFLKCCLSCFDETGLELAYRLDELGIKSRNSPDSTSPMLCDHGQVPPQLYTWLLVVFNMDPGDLIQVLLFKKQAFDELSYLPNPQMPMSNDG